MDLTTFGRPEVLLYHSLSVITERLCTWEWDLFGLSEKHTTNYWGDQARLNDQEVARYRQLSKDTLSWIGWDLWAKCDRQCKFDVRFNIFTNKFISKKHADFVFLSQNRRSVQSRPGRLSVLRVCRRAEFTLPIRQSFQKTRCSTSGDQNVSIEQTLIAGTDVEGTQSISFLMSRRTRSEACAGYCLG